MVKAQDQRRIGRNGIISTDLKLTAYWKFFSLEKAQQEQGDTEL